MASNGAGPGPRLRGDMSRILVQQPMVAATALFMQHRERSVAEPGMIACTDGRAVTVWPAFHDLVEPERSGVLLHEYLHVAFAHPLRGAKMQRRFGEAYRHDVMNVAADAIINEGIRKASQATIRLPAGGVDIVNLAKQAEAIADLAGIDVDHKRMRNVSKVTLEWLYVTLIRLLEAAKSICDGGSDERTSAEDDDAVGRTPSDAAAQARRRSQIEAAHDFMRQFDGPADLDISAASGMSPGDLDDAIREAGERLRNAAALGKGSRAGHIIEELSCDIPQVSTPWESAFRTATNKHLSRTRMRRPTRPGRRMISQEAMGLTDIAWSAGRRRPNVPRVFVVLDSSGSVGAADYTRYRSEIQAMKRRTNAQLFAVVADDVVHSVREIDDVAEIRDIAFEGRGCTDFRPALELAAEYDVDLVVYLTDLMGTYPDKAPSFPVVWTHAGTEVPHGFEPPFGRLLHLD